MGYFLFDGNFIDFQTTFHFFGCMFPS